MTWTAEDIEDGRLLLQLAFPGGEPSQDGQDDFQYWLRQYVYVNDAVVCQKMFKLGSLGAMPKALKLYDRMMADYTPWREVLPYWILRVFT